MPNLTDSTKDVRRRDPQFYAINVPRFAVLT
jgi:hypothetical protein